MCFVAKLHRLDRYIHNGAGGVYLEKFGDAATAPIDLALELITRFPKEFVPWVQKIEQVTATQMDRILKRIPTDWMSEVQGTFAKALVLKAKEILCQTNR